MDVSEPPHNLQHLLAGYVLNDLTPEEIAQVEDLLERDPALAIEIQKLQSILAVFSLALPHAKPPQNLKTLILQAAQSDQTPAKPRKRFQRSLAKWVTVGSAAAIIAGLGIEVTHLQRKLAAIQLENQHLQKQLATTQNTLEQIRQNDLRKTRQELARYQEAVSLLRQPDNRYLSLKGMAPEIPSTGSLVIAPNLASAVLVLRGVEALPEDRVYRMWAVVDGQKVACGDFTPNENGDVFLQLPVDEWATTPEVVITIEPTYDIPEPVGEMVIFGS